MPPLRDDDDPRAAAFEMALEGVMLDLAQQVVRDGEGASKFVEIRVEGALTDGDARKVALSIANSPLVKTAIAGADPNWGRIVMAVGKSGALTGYHWGLTRKRAILGWEAGQTVQAADSQSA